jgi:DivIVA domain-containing protein
MVTHAHGAVSLSTDAISNADFTLSFRGYAVEEVREFLETTGTQIEYLQQELLNAHNQLVTAGLRDKASLASVIEYSQSETADTDIRPGTVIDLQSRRIVSSESSIEDETNHDFDPELPTGDTIDNRRLAERVQAFTPAINRSSREVLQFPSPGSKKRPAAIDELFGLIGEPQGREIEWAREILIRTGEIPVVAISGDHKIGDLDPGAQTHDALKKTISELSGLVSKILTSNLANRLESIRLAYIDAERPDGDLRTLSPPSDDAKLVKMLEGPLSKAFIKGVQAEEYVDVESVLTKLAGDTGDWLRQQLVSYSGGSEDIENQLRKIYQRWKSSVVNYVSGDIVALAFSLGVQSNLKEGSRVVWCTPLNGCCSTGCHDNGLAGSQMFGKAFPTGHTFAPIGPNCRSLVIAL